jgi:prophage regulatory protein
MRILKTNEVVKIIGLSKVTIWRMERSGTFPKRINLSDRRVGWVESEILEWLDSRPKGICAEPVTQPNYKTNG